MIYPKNIWATKSKITFLISIYQYGISSWQTVNIAKSDETEHLPVSSPFSSSRASPWGLLPLGHSPSPLPSASRSLPQLHLHSPVLTSPYSHRSDHGRFPAPQQQRVQQHPAAISPCLLQVGLRRKHYRKTCWWRILFRFKVSYTPIWFGPTSGNYDQLWLQLRCLKKLRALWERYLRLSMKVLTSSLHFDFSCTDSLNLISQSDCTVLLLGASAKSDSGKLICKKRKTCQWWKLPTADRRLVQDTPSWLDSVAPNAPQMTTCQVGVYAPSHRQLYNNAHWKEMKTALKSIRT